MSCPEAMHNHSIESAATLNRSDTLSLLPDSPQPMTSDPTTKREVLIEAAQERVFSEF